MTKFAVTCSWLPQRGETELDVTLGRILMSVNDKVITKHRYYDETEGEYLEIPAYFLAEWIVENWWPLLWEPRKSEDVGDDSDFLDRHCILAAQHGFALPRLLIVPFGGNIQVSATARDAQLADVRFLKGGEAVLSRQEVESELKKFVTNVVLRLRNKQVISTPLQQLWEMVEGTTAEEAQFCRLIGALGMSPYVSNPAIENALESSFAALGERLLMDLCLACTPEDFFSEAQKAQEMLAAIETVPSSTLAPLSAIPLPPDGISLPAWRRGVNAAKRLRQKLGIDDTDAHGANRLFDLLHLDTERRGSIGKDVHCDVPIIVGVVQRSDQDARIALLQQNEQQRRFAAARGVYAAWSSEQQNDSRLLTPAVTRDQQASRAFAAEMMAPLAYIRSQVKGSKISQDRIFDLASNLNIGADVVRKQAQNNGLQVGRVDPR